VSAKREDWLRIIDVNLNRAREAVRVLEDVWRLTPAPSPALSRFARALRHHVGGLADTWGLERRVLLEARDAQGDPGRAAPPGSTGDAVARNCARLAEACRALEEAGRELGLDPEPPARLRFLAYDVERRAALPSRRAEALEAAKLYVLLDPAATERPLPELADAAAAAGAALFQVRLKRGDDRERVTRITAVIEAVAGRGLVIVNDRADLAMAAGADGVHVGEHDVSPGEARRIVGPDRIVGATAHSLEEAQTGWSAGADYLGYGTVFASAVKPERPACGVDEVLAVSAESPIPVYAIGGITPGNCAGLERVAVGSAIGRAGDPAAVVAALLAALQ
jgi:thiamine-phosphate pyrophosphorylase